MSTELPKLSTESLTDFIEKVQNALWQAFRNRLGESEFSYAREVFRDHVIACSNVDGKDYQIPFSIVNDEMSFGDPVEVEVEYVPVGSKAAHEIADICADGRGARLFNEFVFADAPDWFNFLPKPGKYESPRYGEIVITEERNQAFIDNFTSKVYQETLPIDCEHDISASGAVGWIVGMRLNADGGVDAKAEWNDRGKELIEGDRFKYFSPAWFSVWTDPVHPDKQINDVAIGGALTTRPFFKEQALRPLVASEKGLSEFVGDPKNVNLKTDVLNNFTALKPVQPKGDSMADDKSKTGDQAPTAQQFSELQTKLSEAEAALKAAKDEAAEKETALKASEADAKKFSERIDALEKAARTQRYSELAKDWIGDTAKHVATLDHLAMSEKGEESDLFKGYVENQKAAAQVNSKLFSEVGSSAPAEGSATAIIEAKAKQFRESDPKLTQEQAFDRAWEESPSQLREEYRKESSRVN